MTDEEIIEDFKNIVEESRQEDVYEYYYKLVSVLNLIKKQEQEINKLNNVIDRMSKFINIPEGYYCKYKNCKVDKDCKQCIKEYFMEDKDE